MIIFIRFVIMLYFFVLSRDLPDNRFTLIRSRSNPFRGSLMTTLQKAAQDQLRQFIEQIERLEEEKKALAADIRDKFLEAKGTGFDVKAMRQILRLRKKSKNERDEEEGMLSVYMHALGMLEDGAADIAMQRFSAETGDPSIMDAAE